MRRSASLRLLLTACALVLASFAATQASAGARAEAIVTLRGKAGPLKATLTYEMAKRSINGFAIDYTCHGKPAVNDSDVYTIVDGGDDSKALATFHDGHVRKTLKGDISRFTEDGQKDVGSGKLVLDVTVSRTGTKRIVKGTVRVRSAKCPSTTQRLRVSGKA
jgi:hypothetical protein